MREMGEFKYDMITAHGSYLANITSGVSLAQGDDIFFRGNILYIMEHSHNTITVEVKGRAIEVKES